MDFTSHKNVIPSVMFIVYLLFKEHGVLQKLLNVGEMSSTLVHLLDSTGRKLGQFRNSWNLDFEVSTFFLEGEGKFSRSQILGFVRKLSSSGSSRQKSFFISVNPDHSYFYVVANICF